jgi:hypothetical protein
MSKQKVKIGRMFFLNVIVFTFGKYVGRSLRINLSASGTFDRLPILQNALELGTSKARRLFSDHVFTVPGHGVSSPDFDAVEVVQNGIAGVLEPVRDVVQSELDRHDKSFSLETLTISHASESVSI